MHPKTANSSLTCAAAEAMSRIVVDLDFINLRRRIVGKPVKLWCSVVSLASAMSWMRRHHIVTGLSGSDEMLALSNFMYICMLENSRKFLPKLYVAQPPGQDVYSAIRSSKFAQQEYCSIPPEPRVRRE
jgi:hypothetical protein